MILDEYDEQKHLENVRQAGYEEGMTKACLKMLADGKISEEDVSDILNISVEKVKELMSDK